MGLIYGQMSKYSIALEYYEKSLKIRLKILGENNLDTATSFHNIGSIHHRIRNYQ